MKFFNLICFISLFSCCFWQTSFATEPRELDRDAEKSENAKLYGKYENAQEVFEAFKNANRDERDFDFNCRSKNDNDFQRVIADIDRLTEAKEIDLGTFGTINVTEDDVKNFRLFSIKVASGGSFIE